MHGRRILIAALAGSACDSYPEPQAPVPAHYVQNVSYTVNVCGAAVESPATPAVAPEPPATRASSIASCDAFFAKTTACSRRFTSAPHALARFDRAIELARREDRIIAMSGDVEAIAEVEARCAAALRAYESAPCH